LSKSIFTTCRYYNTNPHCEPAIRKTPVNPRFL
jgi:hypothetical protein